MGTATRLRKGEFPAVYQPCLASTLGYAAAAAAAAYFSFLNIATDKMGHAELCAEGSDWDDHSPPSRSSRASRAIRPIREDRPKLVNGRPLTEPNK